MAIFVLRTSNRPCLEYVQFFQGLHLASPHLTQANKQKGTTLSSNNINYRLIFAFITLAFVTKSYGASMADIKINVTPPVNELVNVSNPYSFKASNTGNRDAASVKLEVNLPLTNTSPQKYVLGTLSVSDSRCVVSLGKITCNLGTLRRDKSTIVNFSYSVPVSNRNLIITGKLSTTSADSNPSNNELNYSINEKYHFSHITGPANISNSHCTGSNLSSYFECELFPSSISQHNAIFNADGTLSFPNEPTYYGNWQQSADDQLTFQYYEVGIINPIATFSGFGSEPGCFDGITNFPGSTYLSPYHVCF